MNKDETPLTKEEFEKIVEIQTKYYKIARQEEFNRFKLGYANLSETERDDVWSIDFNLNKRLMDRVKRWGEKEYYKIGLHNIKSVFFIGLYRALIPPIYKYYMQVSSTELEYNFDAKKINGFLKTEYPYLNDTIKSNNKIYIDMRKEIEANLLTERVGYEKKIGGFKGFEKSIIQQMIDEIKKLKKNKLKDKVMKYDKQGLTQQQIADKLKTSQPKVCRILKESNGGTK